MDPVGFQVDGQKGKMKTIFISAKCSDMFAAFLYSREPNKKPKIVGEYDGYVPNFFPGDHGGDYIILEIDIKTGKVINWKRPTQADLKIFKKSQLVE